MDGWMNGWMEGMKESSSRTRSYCTRTAVSYCTCSPCSLYFLLGMFLSCCFFVLRQFYFSLLLFRTMFLERLLRVGLKLKLDSSSSRCCWISSIRSCRDNLKKKRGGVSEDIPVQTIPFVGTFQYTYSVSTGRDF